MAFRLVMDVSSEDDETPQKLRYAMYATKADAIRQAEHELATPAAVKAHREHFGKDDLELHPSGIRILRIEDAKGKTVWEP